MLDQLEEGTTVTALLGLVQIPARSGTCVDGACQLQATVTDPTGDAPAFAFGTIELPAGSADNNYQVVVSYQAQDPNLNATDVLTTTLTVVPVV